MGSAGALTSEEVHLARTLISAGLKDADAYAAIAMYTRAHSRPEEEIIDIMSLYAGLSGHNTAQKALAELRRKNWIIESSPHQSSKVHLVAHSDFPKIVAEFLNDPKFEYEVQRARRGNAPKIEIIGQMNDPIVYQTFGPKINEATNEILLPMINTTPNLAQVQELQNAARNGVKVKILLATPKLVGLIRGNAAKSIAKQKIDGWIKHAKGIDNFQVKITGRASDLWLASSALIDGRTVRLDIYDPISQRSTQGIMLEIISDSESNIALVFKKLFNESWNGAHEPGCYGKILQLLQSSAIPILLGIIILTTGTFFGSASPEFTFTIGVTTGVVANYLPKIATKASSMLHRIRK